MPLLIVARLSALEPTNFDGAERAGFKAEVNIDAGSRLAVAAVIGVGHVDGRQPWPH